MKKQKEVFLHIGFPKTGTSSIQSFFSANREVLEARGILYPLSGDTAYSGQAGLAFAARMKAKKPFDILFSEIDNSPAEKIVISSEYFFMLESEKIKFLAKLFSRFNVTIIVYLRRQDARIASGYLQVLRDTNFRFTGDIQDYIYFLRKHPRRTDYLKFLEPWENSFSMASIRVCVYEEHSGSERLLPGFLDIIECPRMSNLVFLENHLNVAYKPVLNSILRKINLIPLPDKIYVTILAFFNFLTRHVVGAGTVSDHKLLSTEERKAIINEYSASNREVATKYLCREDGRLFDELI